MKKIYCLTIATLILTQAYARDPQNDLAPLEMMVTIESQKYHGLHEGFYRHLLYKMVRDNPYFYTLSSIKKNKEYYRAILKTHIEKLEKKLAQQRNGIISWSAAKGMFSLTLASLSAYLFRYLWKSYGSIDYIGPAYFRYRYKEDTMRGLIGSGINALGCAGMVCHYLNKVVRYQERIRERIQRDKEILTLLE